jgi:hypothetical protein
VHTHGLGAANDWKGGSMARDSAPCEDVGWGLGNFRDTSRAVVIRSQASVPRSSSFTSKIINHHSTIINPSFLYRAPNPPPQDASVRACAGRRIANTSKNERGCYFSDVGSPANSQERLNLATLEPPLGPPSKCRKIQPSLGVPGRPALSDE